jgi:hypothetical protein
MRREQYVTPWWSEGCIDREDNSIESEKYVRDSEADGKLGEDTFLSQAFQVCP